MSQTVRILQVVDAMNRWGVETWLYQVIKHLDRQKFQIDILVHRTEKGDYDDALRDLGCKVIPCPGAASPWRYAVNFMKLVRNYGPYDLIHCHVYRFSGFVVRLASLAGIPVRIVRSSSTSDGRKETWQRRLYNLLMNYWIKRYSTHLMATTPAAAQGLFGTTTGCRILTTGIDFSPFEGSVALHDLRASLDLPPTAKIVGHVGRFVAGKNHAFMLDIAQVLAAQPQDIRFLFVGDGPLRPQIEAQARQLKVRDKIVFTGSRDDVPHLMLGAMDLFLFPSRWEGLGRVVIEAQAAGLPCLLADVIPPEVDLVKPLIHRMSLARPAADWAAKLLQLLATPPPINRQEALAIVRQSSFNIVNNAKELAEFYLAAVQEQLRND